MTIIGYAIHLTRIPVNKGSDSRPLPAGVLLNGAHYGKGLFNNY